MPINAGLIVGKSLVLPSHFFPNESTRSVHSPRARPGLETAELQLRLVAIPTRSGLHRNKEALAQRRTMGATPVTSNIEGVTQRAMLRENFAKDRYNAFHKTKVASLRASPSCIVWPTRSHSTPSCASQTATYDEALSGTVVTAHHVKPPAPSQSVQDDRMREDKLMAAREEFWDLAKGSVRIDAIFLGSPRFDPYRSKWQPDFRRCFFISDVMPYHQRCYHPEKIVAEHALKVTEEKKDVKATRTFKRSRDPKRMFTPVPQSIL